MKKRTAIIVSCLFVSFAAASTSPDDTKLCGHKDETEPWALQGKQDMDVEMPFAFLSDVETSKGIHTYTRIVQNNHKEALLPVSWPEADFGFKHIKPEKCASSEFESSIKWKENTQAFIKYGSTLQHK